jgi:hypothetical protein
MATKALFISERGEPRMALTINDCKPAELLQQLKAVVAMVTHLATEGEESDPDSIDLDEMNVSAGKSEADLWDGSEDEALEVFLSKGKTVFMGDWKVEVGEVK